MESLGLVGQPYSETKKHYESFSYKVQSKIMVVTFNRPQTMNSMNMQYFLDLLHFFKSLNNPLSNEDIRAVVLKSSSKHFSSGLDRELISQGNRASDSELIILGRQGAGQKGNCHKGSDKNNAEKSVGYCKVSLPRNRRRLRHLRRRRSQSTERL